MFDNGIGNRLRDWMWDLGRWDQGSNGGRLAGRVSWLDSEFGKFEP